MIVFIAEGAAIKALGVKHLKGDRIEIDNRPLLIALAKSIGYHASARLQIVAVRYDYMDDVGVGEKVLIQFYDKTKLLPAPTLLEATGEPVVPIGRR